MKPAPVVLALVVGALACRSSEGSPPPPVLRRAPIGLAYGLAEEGLVFRGDPGYVALDVTDQATGRPSVLRRKPGRAALDSPERAVFTALARDVLEVDYEVVVLASDGIVELERRPAGMRVVTSTGATWNGASVVVLREVGVPEREPVRRLSGGEALIVLGAHVAEVLIH